MAPMRSLGGLPETARHSLVETDTVIRCTVSLDPRPAPLTTFTSMLGLVPRKIMPTALLDITSAVYLLTREFRQTAPVICRLRQCTKN